MLGDDGRSIDWQDTTLELPAPTPTWRHALTGQAVNSTIALGELLATLPVAILASPTRKN
jgi:maltooligosyltrehalose synthase